MLFNNSSLSSETSADDEVWQTGDEDEDERPSGYVLRDGFA